MTTGCRGRGRGLHERTKNAGADSTSSPRKTLTAEQHELVLQLKRVRDTEIEAFRALQASGMDAEEYRQQPQIESLQASLQALKRGDFEAAQAHLDSYHQAMQEQTLGGLDAEQLLQQLEQLPVTPGEQAATPAVEQPAPVQAAAPNVAEAAVEPSASTDSLLGLDPLEIPEDYQSPLLPNGEMLSDDPAVAAQQLMAAQLHQVGIPDEAALSTLMGPELGKWLANVPDPEHFLTGQQLQDFAQRLAEEYPDAVTLTEIGKSPSGQPINVLSVGDGDKTVVGYGYVHPNEPIGATGLAILAEGLAKGDPELDALNARFHMVFCANPDMADWNEDWINQPIDMDQFVRGSFRPTVGNSEVDFSFPMPRWESADGDVALEHQAGYQHTDADGNVVLEAPRSESVALADLIAAAKPDLVVSMHNFHTGGAYTFLGRKPSDELADALSAVPVACGIPRQLGEKVDSGRRWRRSAPDVFQEPTLEEQARSIRKIDGFEPGQTWLGHASASQFMEVVAPDAQFIIPEAPHFSHPDFGDTSPLGEEHTIMENVEARQKGKLWKVQRRTITKPNGDTIDVVVGQQPAPEGTKETKPVPVTTTITAGQLGAEMISTRREYVAATDKIFKQISKKDNLAPHPYDEYRKSGNPFGLNDNLLLAFKVDAKYQKPATKAQAADFRWRSASQTAEMVGRVRKYVAAQETANPGDKDFQAARQQLDTMIDSLISQVPDSVRHSTPQAGAVASQLGRVFACLQHSGK